MNRCWHISFWCILTLGCHGQKKNHEDTDKKANKDSLVITADSVITHVEGIVTKDTFNEVKKDSIQKSRLKKKLLVKKQNELQTKTAKIWSEEQINLLNQTDKILLFHVRITEIGSRKLELDSKLGLEARKGLIENLLNEGSYLVTMVESSNGKEFEPNYQLLFEAGEERLTLMFDKESLNMVVANLYGREKHAINTLLIEYIENIKKGE